MLLVHEILRLGLLGLDTWLESAQVLLIGSETIILVEFPEFAAELYKLLTAHEFGIGKATACLSLLD